MHMTSAVDKRRDLNARLASVRAELTVQRRRLEAARSRLRATGIRLQSGRSQYELTRDVALARLQARLDTEPVIEQAKGVVMAQLRCGPDEASDLLRRVSQGTNVSVSVLATRIVKRVAEGKPLPGSRVLVRLSGEASARTVSRAERDQHELSARFRGAA